MRFLVVLVVLLGAASGYHRDKLTKIQAEGADQSLDVVDLESSAVDLGSSTINRNVSWPRRLSIALNETNENFLKLIELLVELSEADCFRDAGFPKSKRSIWEDAWAKMEKAYQDVANKITESADKVNREFHKTFVESGFTEKVKEFFDRVAQEFNIGNMCRNVQKVSKVFRRYHIDDKISTLVSFLEIILCELSRDSETAFRELTENSKYERLMSEKDSTADIEKLIQYIKGLDNIEDPDVPKDLLSSSSSEFAASKTTLIFVLGVFTLGNVIHNNHIIL